MWTILTLDLSPLLQGALDGNAQVSLRVLWLTSSQQHDQQGA